MTVSEMSNWLDTLDPNATVRIVSVEYRNYSTYCKYVDFNAFDHSFSADGRLDLGDY